VLPRETADTGRFAHVLAGKRRHILHVSLSLGLRPGIGWKHVDGRPAIAGLA
jgi:hypothetical protein